MPDDTWPHDVWIDIETGAWGLTSNLRLVRQIDLPVKRFGRKPEMRCCGIDNGLPVRAPRISR